jgi:hypothetical protein
VSILKTLADLARASAKSPATVATITPTASAHNLPVITPQPAMIPTAANARARFERKVNAPALVPAKPGAKQVSGGGSVLLPFVCSLTGTDFAFRCRQNRYSGRLFKEETIKSIASGNGPAPDVQNIRLDDIEWNGAVCPHCSASFTLGPVKCGGCRYTCRGGRSCTCCRAIARH